MSPFLYFLSFCLSFAINCSFQTHSFVSGSTKFCGALVVRNISLALFFGIGHGCPKGLSISGWNRKFTGSKSLFYLYSLVLPVNCSFQTGSFVSGSTKFRVALVVGNIYLTVWYNSTTEVMLFKKHASFSLFLALSEFCHKLHSFISNWQFC